MKWYYASGSERLGPVAQAEFEQLVTGGVVKAETLVWRQGMADWAPYGQLPAAVGGAATAGDDGMEVCAVSGRRYPRREMIRYEGKWIGAEHRDEFFQRQREGVVQPGQFVYGNFWPRFLAKFVDGIIGVAVGAVLNVVLALLLFDTANYFTAPIRAAGTMNVVLYQIFSYLGGVLIGIVYAWFFISRYSATPGKMALGLKVVRADGSPLSGGRIVGRYFAEIPSALILFVGYIMAAWDPERRALHDRICDTRVIKAK